MGHENENHTMNPRQRGEPRSRYLRCSPGKQNCKNPGELTFSLEKHTPVAHVSLAKPWAFCARLSKNGYLCGKFSPMKKLNIILIFILAALSGKTYAESHNVQMLEGEIRAGLTLPIGGYHGGTAQVSAALGIEGRYNFKGTPWDCGIMLDLSTARRGFNHLYDDDSDRWQSNRTLSFAALCDYNFRQGKKINPFVGAALGIALNDVVGDDYFPSKGTSMLFAPRVGIEFIHHIRLMAQVNLSRKGYNNVSLTLGFVIGGRPK